MAFIDSTSTQRVEILRQAEKTANLTRRVTIGSGVLGAHEGVEGGELCTALSAALANIGYSSPPPGSALVEGGAPAEVLKFDCTALVTGSIVVEDAAFTGIELAQTVTTVSNGDTVVVQNSAGALATNAAATVASSTLSNVRLPAPSTIVADADTLPLWDAAGTLITSDSTLTVADGVAERLNMPAQVAAVVNEQELTVPVTGTYTTKATFTVDGGVITGITLS